MKPIIGITVDTLVRPTTVINEQDAPFAPQKAVEAIEMAGGVPVLLPFPHKAKNLGSFVSFLLSRIDGLLIPGGPDLDPDFFGEEPLREIGRTDYQRDRFEIALVKEIVKTSKPVLGICRGLQVINVALGGNLFQDLQVQNADSYIQHQQKAPGSFPTHYATIVADSYLYSVLGGKVKVNSRHHQAVKKLAPLLKCVATASDGVVEALESQESHQILGVQWHPENMWEDFPQQLQLFTDLITRTKKESD